MVEYRSLWGKKFVKTPLTSYQRLASFGSPTGFGGFATDAFEIRDGMRTAARDNEPELSDD